MNPLTRQCWWRLPTNLKIRLQSSASQSAEIKIPNRKERGPTDMLRVLSMLVPKTANTKRYNLQCDPYLYPLTNRQLREMALSKESGRKTALWVKEEHGDLFPENLSEPAIPMYNPQVMSWPPEKETEEHLMKLISTSQCEQALQLYKILDKDAVSIKTKLALLQLLGFHGGMEAYPKVEMQAEKWYTRPDKNLKSTFRYTEDMENLFTWLIKQDKVTVSHAYSTLICSAAFHNNVNFVIKLYDMCIQENIPLSRGAYNAVISMMSWTDNFDKEGISKIQRICIVMNMNGVKANIHTCNSILKAAMYFRQQETAFDVAASVLQEIREYRLEPTLATYSCLLNIFARDDRGHQDEIREILMMAASKKEYTPSHPDDMTFFANAMRITARLLVNRELGELIHETLLTGENYNFLGNTYEEAAYYRYFLLLVLKTTSMEKFEEFYDKLVPYVYQPETIVMEKIIERLQVELPQNMEKYCLKHWHDLMTFFPRQSETGDEFLSLMVTKCNLPKDSPFHEEFGKAAYDMWVFLQKPTGTGRFSRKHVTCSSHLISNIVLLLLRARRYENLFTVFTDINNSSHTMESILPLGTINEVFSHALMQGDSQITSAVLEYVMRNNITGLYEMVVKTLATSTMTPAEEAKLIETVSPYLDTQSNEELRKKIAAKSQKT